jgi:hypothetical protein
MRKNCNKNFFLYLLNKLIKMTVNLKYNIFLFTNSYRFVKAFMKDLITIHKKAKKLFLIQVSIYLFSNTIQF